ncbi:hypothetical protein [Nonomuraea sp. NPDC049504]|uniref:hypothetical protein n=1 Tax=Nonomuraea sp. NPDC049504 TaxID=3154729 RepID=UPI00342428AF
MRDADGGPAATADAKLIADLAVERERINRQIRDLNRSRDVLDEVITAAGGRPLALPRQPARAPWHRIGSVARDHDLCQGGGTSRARRRQAVSRGR